MNNASIRWRNAASLALLILGFLQMLGYLVGSQALRGLGAAIVVSPLPKVFSDVEGLEPFASVFTLRIRTRSGAVVEQPITPELYSRLTGPYKRRNVYGAAIAFGPRLPRTLWEPILCYGFHGPLSREFALPEDAETLEILIETRTRGRNDRWTLDPRCDA